MKFSPCPILYNKNTIYIHIKKLGQKGSRLSQFSVIKISFTNIYKI